jgi:hypothetical protein
MESESIPFSGEDVEERISHRLLHLLPPHRRHHRLPRYRHHHRGLRLLHPRHCRDSWT